VAVCLEYIFGIFVNAYLGVSARTPSSFALLKLNEVCVVVAVILVGTWMFRGSLGSIYIQKGKLKWGLIIGLGTFFLAVLGSIPMASLFNAKDLTLERIIPWIPWLLIAALSNGVMEEIMFRGLFLRKLEPFAGKFGANCLVAFVFTFLHGTVSYTADIGLFLALVIPLALAWGYIMQKTDSVWASILFHAGMDIPIFLGMFSIL
jgi:membrane protease YdiL (CAAX protease family)